MEIVPGKAILATLRRCVFRTMPITVPRGWRSRFRTDADHDSEMMAITVPTEADPFSAIFGMRSAICHHRAERYDRKPSEMTHAEMWSTCRGVVPGRIA